VLELRTKVARLKVEKEAAEKAEKAEKAERRLERRSRSLRRIVNARVRGFT